MQIGAASAEMSLRGGIGAFLNTLPMETDSIVAPVLVGLLTRAWRHLVLSHPKLQRAQVATSNHNRTSVTIPPPQPQGALLPSQDVQITPSGSGCHAR